MIVVLCKGVARLRGGKVDRSSAEGALVEASKASGVGCGDGVSPSPPGKGLGRRLDPVPRIFFII